MTNENPSSIERLSRRLRCPNVLFLKGEFIVTPPYKHTHLKHFQGYPIRYMKESRIEQPQIYRGNLDDLIQK